MPQYQEISHIPLMIAHPDNADQAGTRRSALTSAIDILPTLADLFDVDCPPEVQGQSLLPLVEHDGAGHDTVLSGIFGGPLLIADGRYAFHYRPKWLDSTDLNEYRLLPMHMRGPFSVQELRHMELVAPFDFTKGIAVLKIKARDDAKRVPFHDGDGFEDADTRLFDLSSDPLENTPFRDPEIETRLLASATATMALHDAPAEMYRRFELQANVAAAQKDS
jgi:hypothetical protein